MVELEVDEENLEMKQTRRKRLNKEGRKRNSLEQKPRRRLTAT